MQHVKGISEAMVRERDDMQLAALNSGTATLPGYVLAAEQMMLNGHPAERRAIAELQAAIDGIPRDHRAALDVAVEEHIDLKDCCPVCTSAELVRITPSIPGPDGWGWRCKACGHRWSIVIEDDERFPMD